MGLFPAEPETTTDPHVTFSPGLFRGLWTVEQLRAGLPLEQKTCVMYGKVIPVPRLECWFGSRPYRFGGRLEHPKPWTPLALEVKESVEYHTGEKFDSCFANLYRTGDDCISWHADDDLWIGPTIGSVSFGATRTFRLRKKKFTRQDGDAESPSVKFELGDGDMLVMHAGVQQRWEHCVPREKVVRGARINLTFRQTVAT